MAAVIPQFRGTDDDWEEQRNIQLDWLREGIEWSRNFIKQLEEDNKSPNTSEASIALRREIIALEEADIAESNHKIMRIAMGERWVL